MAVFVFEYVVGINGVIEMKLLHSSFPIQITEVQQPHGYRRGGEMGAGGELGQDFGEPRPLLQEARQHRQETQVAEMLKYHGEHGGHGEMSGKT